MEKQQQNKAKQLKRQNYINRHVKTTSVQAYIM